MNSEKILKNVEITEILGEIPKDINGVASHTKSIKDGFLFFCVSGSERDGNDFAKEASEKGAKMIVSEKRLDLPVCVAVVPDVKAAMAKICKNFYGDPQDELKVIGVVGTNGKTTICHLLAAVLSADGKKTGVCGTIGTFYDGRAEDTSLTTLGTVELYETMRKMADAQVRYLVTEVSAHAIDQRRAEGIFFEALIFTNCTEDHLDYFGDFDTYSRVKRSIFKDNICKYKIVNVDDALGVDIASDGLANVVTYGLDNPADVFAVNVEEDKNGVSFIINLFDLIYDISLPLFGKFNVYNALAVCACAAIEGVKMHTLAGALKKVKPISGRAEPVAEYNGASVFIDYAHTPDGLKKSLDAMKKICGGKLYCVFGCGGNREKEKRPLMGEIAGIIADFTIITSDNPRYEDPLSIIREIESGIRKVTKNYIVIRDRKNAIGYSVNKLCCGDILLVAGKGAEKYQEVLGVKLEFSDKAVVSDFVSSLNGKVLS